MASTEDFFGSDDGEGFGFGEEDCFALNWDEELVGSIWSRVPRLA